MAEQRRKVLNILFPLREKENEEDGTLAPFPSTSVRFDEESRLYEIHDPHLYPEEEDDGGDLICSICLDRIQPQENDIRPSCQHTYHRECLMDWMVQHNHNDCPQCRAPLWDEDVFTILQRQLCQNEVCAKPIEPANVEPFFPRRVRLDRLRRETLANPQEQRHQSTTTTTPAYVAPVSLGNPWLARSAPPLSTPERNPRMDGYNRRGLEQALQYRRQQEERRNYAKGFAYCFCCITAVGVTYGFFFTMLTRYSS